MSGIAGVIRFNGGVAAAEVEAMLRPMARRGPDASRALCLGNAGFGQALLATTAEAHAEVQPWRHPETGCVVVSDSRLDNRPELVRALGLNDRPVDAIGDGELLHAAHHRWGEGCAARLLGDFAFAIWDPRHQSLFLARDIMGVRPLYVHHVPGKLFAFASDTESLLALADVPRRINEGRIADALMQDLEGIDRTSTFYLDIARLPPARWLRVVQGTAVEQEYWQPIGERPEGLPKTDLEWVEAVRAVVEDAVRCRLRASCRVGSMLSGGLDSSTVAALAQRMLEASDQRLPTFSGVDSQGHACVETAAVRTMQAAFAFEAHEVDVRALDAWLPAIHAHLEEMREPFDGTMGLISAVYAMAAHAEVRCVMDGMPADNLYSMGDYLRGLVNADGVRSAFQQASALNERSRQPWPRLRAVQTVAGGLAPGWVLRLRAGWQDRKEFRTMRRQSGMSREWAAQYGVRDRYRIYKQDMAATRLGDPAGSPQSVMTAAYITAAVERYGRVASFHGCEPRHPYLDRRVIELHVWLPLGVRARNGWDKWPLRQAMVILPAPIAWRSVRAHLGSGFNDVTLAALAPRHEQHVAARDSPGCLNTSGGLLDLKDNRQGHALLVSQWARARVAKSASTCAGAERDTVALHLDERSHE